MAPWLSPFPMSLEFEQKKLKHLLPRKAARVRLRVSENGSVGTVLLTEAEPSQTRNWEAIRNTAFYGELEETGVPVTDVVVVPHSTLPRKPSGRPDPALVAAEFPRRRGYLREEWKAWVVNRLSSVLYLEPGSFDPDLEWARYGVDSAIALELVADLEEHMGVRLPQTMAECRNIAELVSCASSHLLVSGVRLPWWRSPSVSAWST